MMRGKSRVCKLVQEGHWGQRRRKRASFCVCPWQQRGLWFLAKNWGNRRKKIEGDNHMTHEERQKQRGLFCLEERQQKMGWNLIAAFDYLRRDYGEDSTRSSQKKDMRQQTHVAAKEILIRYRIHFLLFNTRVAKHLTTGQELHP